MIVYCVPDLENSEVFATLAQAEKAARTVLENSEWLDSVDIERCEMVKPTKENIISIINSMGGNWSLSYEVVKTLRRKA